MLRTVLAMVAGVLVGVVVIGVVEALGHMIFPPPDGLNLKDPEVMKTIMHQIPIGAKIAVLFAWGLGVFAGGLMARFISKGAKYSAWIVALFLFAAAAYTMTTISHPTWMIAGAVVVALAGVFAANALTRSRNI